jgi:hypothetical protein
VMLMSEGQMSDYKGATLRLPALPKARELLAQQIESDPRPLGNPLDSVKADRALMHASQYRAGKIHSAILSDR